MSLLNPEQRNKLEKLIEVLRKRLPNNELLSQLLDDLDKVYSFNGGIMSITDSKIKFCDDDGGIYEIIISPSAIVETYQNKIGNKLAKTEILSLDEYVSVRKESAISNKQLNKQASNISQQRIVRDYKNNELTHERTFYASCSTNLDNQDCFSTETEIYISSNKIAYIRELTIDEKGKSTISYKKSCSYMTKPFNDLENPRQIDEPFIYDSNENEFVTSVSNMLTK